MTGPEQHAATVRKALWLGGAEVIDDALAALDELVALAGRADAWRQVPDGEMLDPYDAACMRADEAEARADELQRERDTLEEIQPFPVETVFSWKHRVDSVQADNKQLRAALEEIAGTDFDEPSDFSELGRIARAALAGVQAEEQT